MVAAALVFLRANWKAVAVVIALATVVAALYKWRNDYADEQVETQKAKMEQADADRAETIRDNADDIDVDGVLGPDVKFRD